MSNTWSHSWIRTKGCRSVSCVCCRFSPDGGLADSANCKNFRRERESGITSSFSCLKSRAAIHNSFHALQSGRTEVAPQRHRNAPLVQECCMLESRRRTGREFHADIECENRSPHAARRCDDASAKGGCVVRRRQWHLLFVRASHDGSDHHQ